MVPKRLSDFTFISNWWLFNPSFIDLLWCIHGSQQQSSNYCFFISQSPETLQRLVHSLSPVCYPCSCHAHFNNCTTPSWQRLSVPHSTPGMGLQCQLASESGWSSSRICFIWSHILLFKIKQLVFVISPKPYASHEPFTGIIWTIDFFETADFINNFFQLFYLKSIINKT